jgi:hypothetical protein
MVGVCIRCYTVLNFIVCIWLTTTYNISFRNMTRNTDWYLFLLVFLKEETRVMFQVPYMHKLLQFGSQLHSLNPFRNQLLQRQCIHIWTYANEQLVKDLWLDQTKFFKGPPISSNSSQNLIVKYGNNLQETNSLEQETKLEKSTMEIKTLSS